MVSRLILRCMQDSIQIIEKPEWVSWDDIHELLWNAHAVNREKGINMAFPSLPGDKIREKIEGKGKMFVALDGKRLVGTAAVISKESSIWCGHENYGYCCFSAVLPEYAGRGIYKSFVHLQEQEAVSMGIDKMMFDSHELNRRVFEVNERNGYKAVDFSVWKDHYNIVMVKWLKGCPYSDIYCHCQFLLHKYYRKLRYKPGRIKRFGV